MEWMGHIGVDPGHYHHMNTTDHGSHQMPDSHSGHDMNHDMNHSDHSGHDMHEMKTDTMNMNH